MTMNYKPVNSAVLLASLNNNQKYVILYQLLVKSLYLCLCYTMVSEFCEFRTNTSCQIQYVYKKCFLSTLLIRYWLSESIICQTKQSITQLFLSRGTPCAYLFLMTIKVLRISPSLCLIIFKFTILALFVVTCPILNCFDTIRILQLKANLPIGKLRL